MKGRSVSFATLDQTLQTLGFRVARIPGSHVAYAHPESGAVIVLRWCENEEGFPVGALARRLTSGPWRTFSGNTYRKHPFVVSLQE
jgi:predicted RNA binding protein YcfA (HicA-like mRNA interferase family)